MRIPGSILRQSHIATYGGGAYQLIPGVEQAGCPKAYELKYVQPQPEGPPGVLALYGTVVHRALYLMEDQGMPVDEALREAWVPGLDAVWFAEAQNDLRRVIETGGILTQVHTIAVEQELVAPLYEDEDYGPIQFGGRLDVVAVDNEIDEVLRLYIVDYKTNRTPPSKREVRHWMQGRSYDWLLYQNVNKYLPDADPDQVEIVVVFDAVKHYALKVKWTAGEREEWQAWAETIARKILRDTEARPHLSPYCNWCEYKAQCPAWQKLPEQGVTLSEKLDGVPLEVQVEKLEKVRQTRLMLEKEEARIRSRIEERVMVEGPIVLGGLQWYREQATSKEVDARQLHAVMGDDFYEVVSPRLGLINDWVEENLDKAPKVEATISEVPGNMQLKTRKEN